MGNAAAFDDEKVGPRRSGSAPNRSVVVPGRVPPHNLQAEESLLGAMLLSRTAIDLASELVTADDFYKPAHGHVYEAVTSLSARGEPVDPSPWPRSCGAMTCSTPSAARPL